MRAIEKDVAAPLADDLVHLAHRERKQRHRGAERDQLGANVGATVAEEVEIDGELVGSNGISTMLSPRTPAGPSWRLLEWPPNGCGDGHDGIARLRQRA